MASALFHRAQAALCNIELLQNVVIEHITLPLPKDGDALGKLLQGLATDNTLFYEKFDQPKVLKATKYFEQKVGIAKKLVETFGLSAEANQAVKRAGRTYLASSSRNQQVRNVDSLDGQGFRQADQGWRRVAGNISEDLEQGGQCSS